VSEGHPLAPIRVLIVDDSEVVASSLERVLAREADIEVVGVARTERDALTIAADEMTDVLVMDYRLGEADGIRAAERVRRIQPAVRVVLLTGDVTDSYMQRRARTARLDGIVAKTGDLTEALPVAVRRAHAGTLSLLGEGTAPRERA
jgi:DNA-binding NarL/FixJ family response regulator